MTWTGTLTLNQCNGLVKKLKSHLWAGEKRNIPNLYVTMKMGDMFLCTNSIKSIKTKLENLDQKLGQQFEIYDAIYYLRELIVQANCNTGINKCLCSINCATDKLNFLKELQSKMGYINDPTDRDFLDTIIDDGSKASMDGLLSYSKDVCVISPSSLEDQITSQQIILAGLEQKRDSLNNESTLMINLPDNIAKLLAL